MTARSFAAAALTAVVVATATAFGVRLWFVVASGPYAATTGFEEFCLYNIWKAAHGLPLYEWPQKPPFLLTSYNVGFYTLYGVWARLWGALDERLVLCTRLLTTLAAVVAAGVQSRLVRRVTDPKHWLAAWALGFCFVFWFGVTCGPWTTVTTRPDVGAVVLSLGGLAFALRAHDRCRWYDWAIASVLYFGAWSFKQSVVWIFAGTLLYAAWTRLKWPHVLALVAPFALLSAGVIWTSGESYRYNVFVVPGIYRWFPGQSFALLGKLVFLSPFFWIFGVVALVRAFLGARRSVAPDSDGVESRRRMLAIVALPPLGFGVVQLALHGSGGNNILEAAVLLAALAIAAWLEWLSNDAASVRLRIGAVLLLMMLPYPLAHLVQAARGIPSTQIHGVSIGNATKLNRTQLEQRRKFAAWMQTLPKPIWIRDAMLQMPWFANDNRYPAFPLDPEFVGDAWEKHRIEDGGFPGLIRQRRFAALLLRPGLDGALMAVARNVGYVEAPVPQEFSSLATEYGLSEVGPRLLLSPDVLRRNTRTSVSFPSVAANRRQFNDMDTFDVAQQ